MVLTIVRTGLKHILKFMLALGLVRIQKYIKKHIVQTIQRFGLRHIQKHIAKTIVLITLKHIMQNIQLFIIKYGLVHM